MDDDYVYETTGIPKPDNYDELKQELKDKQNFITTPPFGHPSGGGEWKRQEDGREEQEDLTDSVWNKIRLKLADFFDPAP